MTAGRVNPLNPQFKSWKSVWIRLSSAPFANHMVPLLVYTIFHILDIIPPSSYLNNKLLSDVHNILHSSLNIEQV